MEVITINKALLVLVLLLCLLLCSCANTISGNHTTDDSRTEPSVETTLATTELTTEPTTEPATEHTTEPLAEPILSEPDGTELTADELSSLQTLFQWPSYYAVASNFIFSSPTELSAMMLLREGPEAEKSVVLSETEKTHLSAVSEGFVNLDTHRISKDAAARALDQYYGLTLEDISNDSSLVYLEETDCFYYYIGDTVGCQLSLTKAVEKEDGTIWVLYSDALGMERTGAMLLKPQADGYQILANQTNL